MALALRLCARVSLRGRVCSPPGFHPDVAPPEQGSLAIFVPLVDLELGGEGEGVLRAPRHLGGLGLAGCT